MSLPLHSTTSLDFVAEYAAAARRFADAVAVGDLRAPVPACPRWTTYDLVVHLGNVHAWAATVVETGTAATELNDAPASHRPRAVAGWYAGKAEDLYAVLRAADLDAPCWNFAGVGTTARFWPRRQTHETLMHLLDLEQARGTASPTNPPDREGAGGSTAGDERRDLLATDGIAEVLEVFLPRTHARGYPAELTEPLTLRTTDTDHVWTLTPRHDGPPLVAVRTEPGADLVEGPAGALWRLLWKRAAAPGTPELVRQRRGPMPLPVADVAYVGNAARIAAFIGSRLTP